MAKTKSKTVLLLLVLFLSAFFIFSPLYVQIVEATPSVVGTAGTSPYVTIYPYQRYNFNASGRFWVFYSNGTDMVYKTSTNGQTWTSLILIKDLEADITGEEFSVWFDGTYLHYAFASSFVVGHLYYRRGTPNSDGTISWSAAEQDITTDFTGDKGAGYPSVSTDSNGYAWIAYIKTDWYASYSTMVTRSGNNNGTWGTEPTGFPYQFDVGGQSSSKMSVIPLTSGKMLAIHGKDAATVKVKRWDGSAWGSLKATTSAIWHAHSYSAVAQGDDVHLVLLQQTTHDIKYTQYTYSTDSFGTETTVQAATNNYPVLNIDTATNNLFCAWETATDHIYYKRRVGGTWDSSPTDWIDESTDTLFSGQLSCFYNAYGGYIGLVYMTQTSPYSVKFDFYTPPPNNAPTNDALTLDLAGASYKDTKTLLPQKQDYKFVYNCSDVDGVTDLTYAEIRLDYASKNVILRATRGTGDSWTFSEQSDPSNYITLNTGGSSHSTSGNQKTFNYLATINWAWGDSAETVGVRGYVTDSQSATDQDDYTDIFGVEAHLNASSLTVNDYHVNPSQTLTFSGYWKYNGTSIAPPDGDYQVKIKLSGTQKGSTDTTLVSGAFSISDVSAESTVNSYGYTVEANYNATVGSFSTVIVDKAVITISANTTSPAPNAYVNFTLTAIYDYDDLPITSWTVNTFRNSTHFASGNFTDGGYTDLFYVYTVENITETTYGLTAFTSNTVTVYWSTYVALTIKPLDLDGNVLTEAIVYFNSTQITVDSNGLATKSGITKYDNITVNVKWHGCWVNGSWTVNMTETKTIEADCNVWQITVNARDNDGTMLSLSPSKFVWNFPNGTQVNATKSDGSWIFKIMNGTHYYRINYQGQWISANVTLPVIDKNVTVINKNCWVYRLTVYVTNQLGVEMSGATLTLTCSDNRSLSDYGLTPKTVDYYNSTHGRYVWTQLANQTSSYTIKATSGSDFNSTTTSLTANTQKTIVITTTISGGPGGPSGGPSFPPVEPPVYVPPVELPKVPGVEFNYGIIVLVGVVGVAATVAVVGRGKSSLESQWRKKTRFVSVSDRKWKKPKRRHTSKKWRKRS